MRCYIFCVVLLGLTCAALAGKRAACPEIYCFISCPNGYVTDKLGCASCSCLPTQEAQSRSCEDWRCLVPCDNGYQLNTETSCLTCTCAPASVVDPNPGAGGADKPSSGFAPPMSGSAPSSGGNGDCNRLRCLVPCDGGYEEDSQGCPTCVCRSSSSGSSSSVDEKPSGPAKTLVSEAGSGDNNNNNNNNMSSGAARNISRFHSWILQILAAMGLRSG